jgi:hypothetical protein
VIEVRFHNEEQLVDQIVNDLVGAHPSCWNVVLPPGFGEELLAGELARRLRSHSRRPRLAVRGADNTNASIGAFVRSLHWQWAEVDRPPRRLDKSADLYLDMLLAELRGSDRPIILILKRFHKVLDNLNEWVLGKLREEEQARRLHTITLTPLPYAHLKRRWESQQHYFSTSDYGDSRHLQVTVEPPTAAEIVALCQPLEISDAVADFARKLTGGYPEALAALLEWWVKQDQPGLAPKVRGQMLELARDQLGVFVEWLDPLQDGHYRDQIINLYHGVDAEQAREVLHGHPWKDVVLDQDGLRAEALGAAALKAALSAAGNQESLRSPWFKVAERARRLYERRQYETVLRVLDTAQDNHLGPQDRLLQLHAKIMRELAGGEGVDHFGEDTDCKKLRLALRSARDLLAKAEIPLADGDKQKIEGRYRQLEQVADAIVAAGSIRGRLQKRLVDILAGFAGPAHANPRSAALVLLLKLEAGRAIAGDASACQFALPLPEQIFRT